MFYYIKKFHRYMINIPITKDFLDKLQNKTIFDNTPDEPYYKIIYQNLFYGVSNIIEYVSGDSKQRQIDYEYIQSVIKMNDIETIESKLLTDRNINTYKETLHKIPIIKEVEDKTDKMLKLDPESDISCAIIKFTAGNCWFNSKLSWDFPVEPYEQHMLNQLNKGVSLVEPLSTPISLFHGFEKYTRYNIIGKYLNVKGIVAKTLSYNVAKRFAYSTNNLKPKFLLVHYDKESRHIKQSIRPFDEEFEFLSHSDETFKVIRICKFFDGLRLLTFYVCTKTQ